MCLEPLETRELLSVSAADYEAIRLRYGDLGLCADYGAVNIIELEQLSARSLQEALDAASLTRKDDLIVVDTDVFATASLMINSGVTVDVDSGQYGSITVVSNGARRLDIISAAEEAAFTVARGELAFGGINFCRAEADSTVYSLHQSLLVDAPRTTWTTVDCSYFSNSGEDISPQFTDQWAVEAAAARLKEAAEASVRDTASADDNYAVIFMGGYNQPNNAVRYYQTLEEIYDILLTNFSLSADNVYILFGNGERMQTLVGYDNSNVVCDLSFVTNLYRASETNLTSVLGNLAGKMTDSSHLLFYTYDHGDGVENAPNDYNDYLCAWGGKIAGSKVAEALFQIQAGYVTCAFGQCFSGGVLDDIFDPQTGEVVGSYGGSAHFAGMAAANHYEVSWTSVADNRPRGVIQEFNAALLSVEGLDTISVFERAIDRAPFIDRGQWERNKGTWKNGSVEHPWYAGESFSIFLVDEPENTFTVTLSRQEPEVGDTLWAIVTPDSAEVTYQWYRGTSASALIAIAGETSASYTVTSQDIGYYLRVIAAGQGEYSGLRRAAATAGVVVSRADDIYEPNDSFAAAADLGTITGVKRVTGLVAGAKKDQDWYKFTLKYTGTAADSIVLTYNHTKTHDVDLSLFKDPSRRIGSSTGTTGKETISLKGLSPGTYYIRANNYHDAPEGVGYSLTITTPAELDAPALSVTAAAASSLTVSVGAVAGASRYTLEYSSNANFSSKKSKTLTKAGEAVLTSLKADTTYYVRVKASGSGIKDSGYTVIETRTAPIPRLDSPTLAVTAEATNALTICVGTAAGASRYTLEYAADADFSSKKSKTLTKPGEVKLTSLKADTTYYVRVKASGSNATDSPYTVIQTKTAAIPRLDSPSVTVTAEATNALTISVGAVAGASRCTLEYSTSADFGSKTTKTLTKPGEVKLTSLKADTAYYVRVKASGTGAIDSQYTIIQTKTAAIPHLDSPTLAVKSAATNSLTISVGAVAGASRYTLEYSASADFSSKKTKTLTKPGEVNLTLLKADTAYYVRVKAIGSGAADSPYGGPMEARTLSAALSNAPSPNTLLANGLTGQSAEGALLSSDMIAAAGAVLEDDPLFETLAASAQAWEPPVKSTYTGGYAAAEAYDTDELEICLDLLAGEAAFGREAVL